jgi:hypothetical protein
MVPKLKKTMARSKWQDMIEYALLCASVVILTNINLPRLSVLLPFSCVALPPFAFEIPRYE